MTEMATGSNVTPKGISLVSGAIFALVGSFDRKLTKKCNADVIDYLEYCTTYPKTS
jgi:hypothetical protein